MQRILTTVLACALWSMGGRAVHAASHGVLSTPEEMRIERLAGLGRLWGLVKYSHPYLGYRPIDWDRALIESIPRVNGAATAEEYATAVNHMLSFLKDPLTRAQVGKPERKSQPPAEGRSDAAEAVQVIDGALRMNMYSAGQILARDVSQFRKLLEAVTKGLESAKGVVIDLRGRGTSGDSYWLERLLTLSLPKMAPTNVPYCTTRYRVHNGYSTQAAGGTTFYYSGMMTAAPPMLRGERKGSPLPIAVIVNHETPAGLAMAGGLQAAELAVVVQEGEGATEPGGEALFALPENVEARIRTTEMVYPDGSIGFQADKVVPPSKTEDAGLREALKAVKRGGTSGRARKPGAAAAPLSVQDNPYPQMEFPNAEYRLLALFRFWNVIQYFFPYKDLQDEAWEATLRRFIPRLEACKNTREYQATVMALAAQVKDSHVGVRGAIRAIADLGEYSPPAVVRLIEGQTVVTRAQEGSALRPGDVIESIDGERVGKRRERISELLAASTPQALNWKVDTALLFGAKEQPARISATGADGNRKEVTAERTLSAMDPKFGSLRERTGPVTQVLPSGYGYADLDRLQPGEVDALFETIKGTPAVIFDMRGYPNSTAWSIAPRLTEKQNVTAALFSRPFLEGPAMVEDDGLAGKSYGFAQTFNGRKEAVYRGKVVVLIDESAISQAEHTCLYLEAATNVTFIGTPTNGANGDVTAMVLPGNLAVSFTGHNVRHGDGRQLQRVGIQPHIRAAPTVKGIRAGRDEVLDAAVTYLKSTLSP